MNTTDTNDVRGRFDALHGTNRVCKTVTNSAMSSPPNNTEKKVKEKKRILFWANRGLTALLDCLALLRKLDKDDVAKALLSIVRDRHRPDAALVVKLDQLVVRRVSFRWNTAGRE